MVIETTLYKTELENMLKALTKELKSIGVHNPNNEADWIERTNDMSPQEPDPNDVADRTKEWGKRRATLAVLETRYNNINRALKKIESGTYGVCEISGETIEEDRLHANPAARTNKAHMKNEDHLSL